MHRLTVTRRCGLCYVPILNLYGICRLHGDFIVISVAALKSDRHLYCTFTVSLLDIDQAGSIQQPQPPPADDPGKNSEPSLRCRYSLPYAVGDLELLKMHLQEDDNHRRRTEFTGFGLCHCGSPPKLSPSHVFGKLARLKCLRDGGIQRARLSWTLRPLHHSKHLLLA